MSLCAELLHLRQGLGRGDTKTAPPPDYRTQFIDSEARVAEVTAEIGRHRLVTLVGPAGSGKTRLAAEVAQGFDGTVWVDLASTGSGGVVEQLARSAGSSGDLSLAAIASALNGRGSLLVFDNCEHVLSEASRVVARLMRAAPDLRILATTRAPLEVSGERTFGVRPLHVAGKGSDAVELFLNRARLAGCREFGSGDPEHLDAAMAQLIEDLCARLDGLPLAIEMAASRTASIGARVLLERTEASLGLIRSGSEHGVGRHRSLEDAIRSSFQSLSTCERQVFLCLSVFQNGWTLRMLGDVLERAVIDGATRHDALEALGSLTRASLVVREPEGTRWHLLQTIKTFTATELSLQTGEASSPAARIRQAHSEVFLELGQRANASAFGAERVASFQALEADLGNFLVAIETSSEDPGRAENTAVMAADLFEFWISRGLMSVAERVLRAAVEKAPLMSAESRASCALSLGTLAHRRGLADVAEPLLREAVSLGSAQE